MYLCAVKCEKTILRSVLLALFLLFVNGTICRADKDLTPEFAARIDSTISVGFITCGPGPEVYSLYGHTALHFKDTSRGTDVAVNWGMFSFSKPNFVLRFVFGLTDYEIGIQDFAYFCEAYRYEHRWVKEQQLDLTPREKLLIAEAIEENYRPENREYRYNYFYDNCTTRARDMIANHLSGKLDYGTSPHEGLSFRQLIHQYCEGYPWVRFGNDILLGLQADAPTTAAERQFLPNETMADLDRAVIDGSRRLVVGTSTLVDVAPLPVEAGFPLSPGTCGLILYVVVVALTVWEIISRKDFRWFDAVLMVLCGLSGLVLFAMLFSQHPTVRLNLQLLLLNPLPLFFVWPMLRHRCRWQYAMWIVLICLFFIGFYFQHYAEGTMFVASSLLIRNIKRFYSEK